MIYYTDVQMYCKGGGGVKTTILLLLLKKNRCPQKRPLSPGRRLKSSIRKLSEQRTVGRDYR